MDQLDKAFKLLKYDFNQYDDDFEELQTTVENVDNMLRKNNMSLKVLKEGDRTQGSFSLFGGAIYHLCGF